VLLVSNESLVNNNCNTLALIVIAESNDGMNLKSDGLKYDEASYQQQ